SVSHEFRTTAVKGLHVKEDFIKIARLLKGEKKYFIQKFVDSGNLLKGGEAFSKDEMHEILEEVRKYIPEAELRGEE
ncbi:MAG: anaerobic ribonucleoside-triphosphate reductase activating protein, partial [Clostridia bacterium]|nr:anaerobic ribonucleoside-triphosphate reductase activating protein [Clostridia bacterium]